jgi:hypothetical protein
VAYLKETALQRKTRHRTQDQIAGHRVNFQESVAFVIDRQRCSGLTVCVEPRLMVSTTRLSSFGSETFGQLISSSICLDSIKDTDNIRPLPCDHIFHQRCFDKWLRKIEQATKCPLCRVDFIDSAKWPRPPRPVYAAHYEGLVTA